MKQTRYTSAWKFFKEHPNFITPDLINAKETKNYFIALETDEDDQPFLGIRRWGVSVFRRSTLTVCSELSRLYDTKEEAEEYFNNIGG